MTHFNKLIRSRELKKFGKYRLWKYKLDPALLEEMLAKQSYRCAICRNGSSDTLLVNHDHETKRVRGLLCNSCNSGIDFFNDDIALLRKAVVYLRQ
jgi:Recombination endonuclease VII